MKKIQNLGWILSIVMFVASATLITIQYISTGKVTDTSWLKILSYSALGLINILMLLRSIDLTMMNFDKEYKSTVAPKKVTSLPLWKFFILMVLIAGSDLLVIYLGEHIWCLRDAAIYLETFLICFSGLFILTKHN